jgi:excisionase family DNA binding protein
MDNTADLPNMPEYVSIKEAAEILNLSANRVYEFVMEGRLSGVRAADVIMIPLEEVKQFKRGSTGRPRKNQAKWRLSSRLDALITTLIFVSMYDGKQGAFAEKLAEIRQKETHTLSGTIARFVMMSDTTPNQVQILLIWRSSLMPEWTDLERELDALRQELADVLDWDTAQYSHGKVFMHT